MKKLLCILAVVALSSCNLTEVIEESKEEIKKIIIEHSETDTLIYGP